MFFFFISDKQPLAHNKISCDVSVLVVRLCVLVVVISVCGSCCLCGLVAVRCVGLFAVAGRLPLWGVLRLVWAAESWLRRNSDFAFFSLAI